MYTYSFWKKHANDSDWDSRYIDLDRASALSDFTATVVGTGTATLGPTGLTLVNSAGANDTIQYQYTNPTINSRAPKVGTVLDPSSYSYEMEFIIQGTIFSPQNLNLYAGFASTDTTLLPGRTDSIGLVSLGGSAAIGLDSYTGGSNNLVNYPAGGPNPNAFAYLPADGVQHELTFQVIPLSGTGNQGEIKIWLDGKMLADFGLADPLYWIGLTQAFLAPSFAMGNATTGLSQTQRTAILSGIGWATRE